MKKNIIPKASLESDVHTFIDTLNQESDTVRVVVGAAFIDALLASLLTDHFRKSKTTGKLLSGALADFSIRANIAYCLHLIDKQQYLDLCTIAEIRNLFAHSHLNLSFTNNNIATLCEKLTTWRLFYFDNLDAQPTIKPVNKFLISIAVLAEKLLWGRSHSEPQSINPDISTLTRLVQTSQTPQPGNREINPTEVVRQSWKDLEKTATAATSVSDPFSTAFALQQRRILTHQEAKAYYKMSDISNRVTNMGAQVDVNASNIYKSVATSLLDKINWTLVDKTTGRKRGSTK